MNTLKLIYQTLLQLAKQTWQLPHSIGAAIKRRQHQAVLNERETERLDRIRNPSKYLGVD